MVAVRATKPLRSPPVPVAMFMSQAQHKWTPKINIAHYATYARKNQHSPQHTTAKIGY